jgi:hypothetical protein
MLPFIFGTDDLSYVGLIFQVSDCLNSPLHWVILRKVYLSVANKSEKR